MTPAMLRENIALLTVGAAITALALGLLNVIDIVTAVAAFLAGMSVAAVLTVPDRR